MSELLEQLRKAVGESNVLAGESVRDDYTHDEALTTVPVVPLAVVMPGSTNEASEVLQVASEHARVLADAARRGANMRVTIRLARQRVTARNVVATVRGSDRSAPSLVVMTPRSSWWTSTAERGGGLVCWLACLKAVLAAPPVRDVVFTANSGHELGHLGL